MISLNCQVWNKEQEKIAKIQEEMKSDEKVWRNVSSFENATLRLNLIAHSLKCNDCRAILSKSVYTSTGGAK